MVMNRSSVSSTNNTYDFKLVIILRIFHKSGHGPYVFHEFFTIYNPTLIGVVKVVEVDILIEHYVPFFFEFLVLTFILIFSLSELQF